ncbi:MAG: phage tail protein [Betaproteobacteria bacterium]|jgi:phage tail protein X|nr:phage tail protein [Betaproteobacteria bacterium]NBT82927.1 phage tail protein [Betaproteobacteria bacterium]
MNRPIFKRVVTHEGDVLDDLVWRHYGRNDLIAAVLESNPHLAQLSPVMEAGLVIEMPGLLLPAEAPVIRLWS